jgi:hypothetical protein
MGGGHGHSWSFHRSPWGASRRGEGGGEGRGGRGHGLGAAWGGGGLQEGHRACSLAATAMREIRALCCSLFHAEREVEGKKRGKEKKKEKEKN